MSYPGPGFIREEKDVMYLILFALGFFPMAITESDLMDVVLVDDGFGYFEFCAAFSRLQERGFVSCRAGDQDKVYALTAEGAKAMEILASSLPLSVRDKAQRAALRVIAKLRRDASIKAYHTDNPDGTFTVHLKICDAKSDQLSVEVLAMTRRQCELMEDNFRRRAETLYPDLLQLLSGGGTYD